MPDLQNTWTQTDKKYTSSYPSELPTWEGKYVENKEKSKFYQDRCYPREEIIVDLEGKGGEGKHCITE